VADDDRRAVLAVEHFPQPRDVVSEFFTEEMRAAFRAVR
jgi:hypothetical protein